MARKKTTGAWSYKTNMRTGEIVFKQSGELSPEMQKEADGWREFAEEQNALPRMKVGNIWLRLSSEEVNQRNPAPPVSSIRMTKANKLQFYAYLKTVASRFGLSDEGFEIGKAASGLGLTPSVLNAILAGYTQVTKSHLQTVASHLKLSVEQILDTGCEMMDRDEGP